MFLLVLAHLGRPGLMAVKWVFVVVVVVVCSGREHTQSTIFVLFRPPNQQC